jgi:hypothetical protein
MTFYYFLFFWLDFFLNFCFKFFSFYFEMNNNISTFNEEIPKNINRVVIIFGLTTNFACFFIFLRIIKNERQIGYIFKFLLIKAINDFIYFIFEVSIEIVSLNEEHEFSKNWKFYVTMYLSNVIMTSSGFIEAAATLDCYLNISNKLKWFQKKRYFYIQLILIYGINLTTYSSYLIIYKRPSYLQEAKNEPSKYEYKTEKFNLVKVIQNIIRDLITGILLIVLNLLIFKFTHRIMKRKVSIQNIDGRIQNNQTKAVMKRIRQSENQRIKTIIFICFNYIIGHTPIFVFNFCTLIDCIPSFGYNNLAYEIAVTVLNISFISPIFIHLFFNITFFNAVKAKSSYLISVFKTL